jgi:hypothetical protein
MMKRRRRFIQRLNPYLALTLLAVPLAIVEPLKLVAIFIFGKGHWVTGTAVMFLAYAGSLFVVEKLFKTVKPRLLTIPWFATLWEWFILARAKTIRWWRLRFERHKIRETNRRSA